jgi:hypothetical protein
MIPDVILVNNGIAVTHKAPFFIAGTVPYNAEDKTITPYPHKNRLRRYGLRP